MNGPGTKGTGMDEEMVNKMVAMGPEKCKEFMDQILGGENHNPRDILAQMVKKAKEEARDLPLYYTEWNAGHFDTSYAAAAVTQILAYNEGLVEGYSYWCISDIFEEQGLYGLPFHNEFGLVNVYGIRKPVYRIFEALHQAGTKRLEVYGDGHRTAEILALSNDGEVMIFAYNHDIEARDICAQDLEITVSGKYTSVQKAVIDDVNCNPLAVWEAQGKPAYPDREQIAQMEESSRLVFENIPLSDEEPQVLYCHAAAESVTIFRLSK